jgi:hypothetical protein
VLLLSSRVLLLAVPAPVVPVAQQAQVPVQAPQQAQAWVLVVWAQRALLLLLLPQRPSWLLLSTMTTTLPPPPPPPTDL